MLMREKLLSVKQIVQPDGLLPVSRSVWYAGIKTGRYPGKIQNKALGGRAFWLREDIENIIKSITQNHGANGGDE